MIERVWNKTKKQWKSCWCFFGWNQLFVEHASRVARYTAEKRAQLNKRLIVKNQLFARHLCVCLSIWCFLSTYVFLLQESVVCYSVSMYPMLLGEESTAVLFLARSQLFVVLVCFIRNRLFGQHLLFVRKQLFYWASVSFVRNQLFAEHLLLQGNNCFIEHLFYLSGISCLLSTCLGWRAMPRRSTVFSPSSGTTCSGSAPAFTFLKDFSSFVYQHHSPNVCPVVGIGTTPPPSRRRVCNPPPLNQRRWEHTRLRIRGWGSPNSNDLRKSPALCLL